MERIEGTMHQEKLQSVQSVREMLVEAGVIGGVVSNFNPTVKLTVTYRDKQISFGEELSFSYFQSKPNRIHWELMPTLKLVKKVLKERKFIVIMTDPHRNPGCEYLHWLITDCDINPEKDCATWKDLVAYEPPAYMPNHMIVFTIFIQPKFLVSKPQRRVLFSTRVFAASHGLGTPLGAAFCYIEEVKIKDQDVPSTSSNIIPSSIQDFDQKDQIKAFKQKDENKSSTASTLTLEDLTLEDEE